MKGITTTLATIPFADQSVDFSAPTSWAKNMAVFPHKPRKIQTSLILRFYKAFKALYVHSTTLIRCQNFYNHLKLLQEINEKVESVRQNQANKSELQVGISELKELLSNFTKKAIDNLTPNTAITTATKVVSATTLADKVHANFTCKNCGTHIGLLIGSNYCPNCKTPIT